MSNSLFVLSERGGGRGRGREREGGREEGEWSCLCGLKKEEEGGEGKCA